MLIHTRRLRLITCELAHLEAIAHGPAALQALTGVAIPEGWPVYPSAYRHAHALLKKQPLRSYSGWWLYLMIDPVNHLLVGSCGFKDAPDAQGIVEIGCEVVPGLRRQGYATESLRGLIAYAFTRPEVKAVDAFSQARRGAQSALVQALGLRRIGDAVDPDGDRIWHWRITYDGFLSLRQTAGVK